MRVWLPHSKTLILSDCGLSTCDMSKWSRRRLLRTGVVGAVCSVAGCNSPPAESTDRLTTFDDETTQQPETKTDQNPYIDTIDDSSFRLVNPRSKWLRVAVIELIDLNGAYALVFNVAPQTAEEFRGDDGISELVTLGNFQYDPRPFSGPDTDVTARYLSHVPDIEPSWEDGHEFAIPIPADIPSSDVQRVQYLEEPTGWRDEEIAFRGTKGDTLRIAVQAQEREPYWHLPGNPSTFRIEGISDAAEFSVGFPRPEFTIEDVTVQTEDTDNGLQIADAEMTVSAQSSAPVRELTAYLVAENQITEGNPSSGAIIVGTASRENPTSVMLAGTEGGNPFLVSPQSREQRVGQRRRIRFDTPRRLSLPLPENETVYAYVAWEDAILGVKRYQLRDILNI